jgi:hypothetical protein
VQGGSAQSLTLQVKGCPASPTATSGNLTVSVSSSSPDLTGLYTTGGDISFGVGSIGSPQIITITPIADSIFRANVSSGTLTITGVSDFGGETVNSLTISNVSYLNTATAAINVNKTSLSTFSGGQFDTFTVALDSQPTGNVVLDVSSSNSSKVAVSPATLTFTSSNWSTAQTVTVTGSASTITATENDSITIAPNTNSTLDTKYLTLASIAIPVLHSPSKFIYSSSSLALTFGGSAASLGIRLSQAPSANVALQLTPRNEDEFSLSTSTLTFTPANWATTQTLSVSPASTSSLSTSTLSYIDFTVSSTDTSFSNANASAVEVRLNPSGLVFSQNGVNLSTAASDDQVYVRLASQPSQNVVVGIGADQAPLFSLTQPAGSRLLTFTSSNWNQPQLLKFHADAVNATYEKQTAYLTFTTTSSDSAYNNLALQLPITKTPVNFIVTKSDSISTTDAGAKASFTLALAHQPSSDRYVTITPSVEGLFTIKPRRLSFNRTNWDTPQTVTLQGFIGEITADKTATLGLALSTVTAPITTVSEQNVMSVTHKVSSIISASNLNRTLFNNDNATFNVVLTQNPGKALTINLDLVDNPNLEMDKDHLTFDSDDWQKPQTVTITNQDPNAPLAASKILFTPLPVDEEFPPVEAIIPAESSAGLAFALHRIAQDDFALNSKKPGCFVATAAFQDPAAAELKILRNFRDFVLHRFALGRKFISAYYELGPALATWIAPNPLLRFLVRGTLYPLVWGIAHPWLALCFFSALAGGLLVYSRTREYE